MAVKNESKTAVVADRGSDNMTDDMFSQTQKISSGDLRKIINITRQKGAILKDWSIYGKPQLDFLRGVLQADHAVATKIIQDMLAIDGLRLRLDVFPLGTPKPDMVQIGFRTPGRGR